jgi:hypothetical protein
MSPPSSGSKKNANEETKVKQAASKSFEAWNVIATPTCSVSLLFLFFVGPLTTLSIYRLEQYDDWKHDELGRIRKEAVVVLSQHSPGGTEESHRNLSGRLLWHSKVRYRVHKN